ncbi:MAG: 2-oxoglutarate dehydrogenase, E2 component, dihydrolipoamide succinyltransferase, partial [Actinomycetota bacterium]|nr:2-oxoglutarate dehydrogenase, E2 component, dihydrolipoamide succinyltransferase [Actinomycetota bacterium]
MATKATVQVLMPEMGESVTEGTVLEWLVGEGDSVEEGQTIVEVSTDKVDAEVPATSDGAITKIHVAPDETIEVGKPLADIDPNAETPSSSSAAPSEASTAGNGDAPKISSAEPDGASASPAPASQPDTPAGEAGEAAENAGEAEEAAADADAPSGEEADVTMPEMGESVTEGTVLEWHVAEGDSVEEGETIVEVSTDKVDAEVPAPFSGTITKIHVGPDETIEVGKPLASIKAASSGIKAASSGTKAASPGTKAASSA